jgi:hypothetical protein
MKSINHPWAISDKYATRYGEVWTSMDFVFNDKISAENFSTDPMNTAIGYLELYKQQIPMTYRDIINSAKTINTTFNEVYASREKGMTYDIRVKSQTFTLQRHELRKLAETLSEAQSTALKSYELGLYL